MKALYRETMSRARHVVINADDFGLSSEVNQAIIRAFAEGLISSTTIMSNMPAFEEACRLVKLFGLHGRVGLHLNMTYGKPLSSAAGWCPDLCTSEGNFHSYRHLLRLDGQARDALEAEFEAQFQACVKNGIQPTHLDSHHDMHMQLAVTPVVVSLALRHSVVAVRIAGSSPPMAEIRRRPRLLVGVLLRAVHNRRLRAAGLARTRYFGSCSDIQRVIGKDASVCEVMVHPRINADGALVDQNEVATLLSEEVRALGVRSLSSYTDLLCVDLK
jgi:predicted glycoside hydrolase/deacetylase ChbG (UPF0249 family)